MIQRKWRRRLQKASELGLQNIMMCLATRCWFRLIHFKFKFDPWHYKGTYHCRPYQRIAVKLVNNLQPKVVVEIGCGLGEIISRVNATRRIGYDLDGAVIEAAKFIRSGKVNFYVGTGNDVQEKEIDVLILLNWIHDLSPQQMMNFLEPFYKRVSYFVLEGITPGEAGYKFFHDFKFLSEHAELVEAIDGGFGEPRKLMIFKVLKNVC